MKQTKTDFWKDCALWICAIIGVAMLFFYTGMFNDLRASVLDIFGNPDTQMAQTTAELAAGDDAATPEEAAEATDRAAASNAAEGASATPPSTDKPVFDSPGSRAGLEELQDRIAGKGISTEDSVILVALGWIDFALPFAGLLAFVGLVYAGFLYVTAFGNEEQASSAKNIVFWVALGLILIFSAYAIVSTLIGASTAGEYGSVSRLGF